MRMQKIGHIAAALALVAGFIYLAAAPKDDAAMAEFKGKAAAFIRSEKQSAPLRDVLGRRGDRICIKHDGKGGMEINLYEYKVLTVMKGRDDITVDGKSYTFTAHRDCFPFAAATFGKEAGNIVIGDTKEKSAKPKQKKKAAPAPEKKKPVQRSYGY